MELEAEGIYLKTEKKVENNVVIWKCQVKVLFCLPWINEGLNE